MSIVHIICSFTTGGAELMLIDIINEQLRHGDKVRLIVINNLVDNRLISQLDKRVEFLCIGRQPGSRNVIPIGILNLKLLTIKIDVLHCHDSIIAGMLLPPLWRKMCLTVHTLGIPKTYLLRYRKIISISDSVQTDLYNRLHISSSLIKNGIVIDKIKRKEKLSPVRSSFRIVIVGRLEHLTKGQHILIEALKRMRYKKTMNLQIDFIGDGSSKELLQSLVLLSGLDSSVNFLGLRDRDFIYAHLHKYDLLIQPSINEGFGLTVVEAMIARVPVLVSGEGPVEIVCEGKYGCIFPAGDIRRCCEKLLWMIENYVSLEDMVDRAAKYAEENFSLKHMISMYEDVYICLKNI